ncbi:MAG: D-alanine--D-alanine ligase [Fibrobacterota bacterium]|nr:D-alanine--D-alanine ligase [Fibrobacterota bacterium]
MEIKLNDRPAKKKVGVLMGGISSEHSVSLVSGSGMLKSLDPSKYLGFPILISKDNTWSWPDLGTAYPPDGSTYGVDSAEKAAAFIASHPSGWVTARFPDFRVFPRCDIMLIGLHGVGGEDGRLQGFFELAGQPYSGSGSLGSALAMDKITAKRIYQSAGIPTARYRVLSRVEYPSAHAGLEKEFGFPLVLKDPHGGSSIGMGIAYSSAELDSLLASLGKDADRLLVEEFIKGLEGTCGVIANFPPVAPTEIRPVQDGFFNFEAKYKPGRAVEITPAGFPPEIIARMQSIAARCHEALQLSVYSRTDFIYVPGGKEELIVLETNNLPGFTPNSLLPKAAEHAGLSYSGLLTKVIEESFAKHA